ncbi:MULTISPECIES: helix-turn-helix domain-containing protein [unclassified Paraburkholderia]|uniref:winged helix-turn-helix transcriptional regulator n=1 Tax=unclassified Paraburkholderia TaxID=2615204 RepID=UPI0016165876|nr:MULTISPECIES: helix-turn-helix domain-containing protein [unclassified Paraburkholderia]MBB5447778.1 DNA-binding HxlR family transcriptional regulator [Paraburkholderia sp. WSM4177]MBB5488285.1 DNA-binding HxlR family transcriptional regulator [Paraburkholderia sp. WSM4180]
MTCVLTETGTVCPVSTALEVVGDPWTLLILRELFGGATRFDDIQVQTETPTQELFARLDSLEQNGLIFVARQGSVAYGLTEKGRAIYPMIYALRAWGEKWTKPEGSDYAVRFTHKYCGTDVGLDAVCRRCGVPVERAHLEPTMSPEWKAERARRQEKSRAAKEIAVETDSSMRDVG